MKHQHCHLDHGSRRDVVEEGSETQPRCAECVSRFGMDGRTMAAMLSALDATWVLLDATIMERGERNSKDRCDLESLDRARNATAAALGLYALHDDMQVVSGALNIALVSGIHGTRGSGIVRAARLMEAFWRHLGSGCPRWPYLVGGRTPEYPTALPLERASELPADLRRKSADEVCRRRVPVGGCGKTVATLDRNGKSDRCVIHGVEILVADRRFRGLARAVLGHIGDRYPEDLDRIRRRVSRIEPMRPSERPPYVDASYGGLAHGTPEYPVGEPEYMAWPIKASRPLIEGPRERLVEVLVHELGHAASTPEDVEVRSGLGGEWGSELAADHHAAKWGFGRLLTSMRSGRCAAHHGPMPGEEVVVAFGKYRVAWSVTDDRVPVCEGLVR